MNHIKLQKLCYYAVAWHYALLERSFITNDEFQAWVHGPVSVELYEKYKIYRWNRIPQAGKPSFDEDTEAFLEVIWNSYGDYNGFELESLTHQELPWVNARGDLGELEPSTNVISVEDMKKYYFSMYEE
ncbi:Panacea domain-containing protein [Methanococcus voltae]|uniref:Panacea domain-containing protein n=1 Tax=Methanococcus voltae TaxID=2188 RepID=UPI001AE9594E|nr:type II toxin-antitoxin system antitoxin SocA domain-containing protein [Methanococcus voltae]